MKQKWFLKRQNQNEIYRCAKNRIKLTNEPGSF